MARNDLENMSYAELTEMESKLARLKLEKQNQERTAVKERIMAMAKDAGFDIQELFGRGRGAVEGRKGRSQVPRSQEPRKYLDRSRTHAALDDRGDQRQQVQARRLPHQVD